MRNLSLISVFCLAAECSAQVLAPPEIADPALRSLQQEHFDALKAAAAEITSHAYPHRFYLSRFLDVNESKQQSLDQRSIRFAALDKQTVVQVTGNYFAAYAADRMTEAERARQTYLDVMLPIIKAVSPRVENEKKVDAIAIEVSHHTRRKVLGVPVENAENVTLIVPRETAARIASARDPEDQVAQLSGAQLFVDSRPILLWSDKTVVASLNTRLEVSPTTRVLRQGALPEEMTSPVDKPPEDLSSTALAGRQITLQATLDRMVRNLDAQAHFIAYAPPSLIVFHNRSYLQLSLTASLPPEDAGSQYRVAALAFDRNVSRLIRPVLTCFTTPPDFSGIVFSTTVRVGTVGGIAQSVEFFFPIASLRSYETYDLTGQQLIDSGYVLVNGERVELNLQNAESSNR